ncbi:YgjV family protein [Rhodoplanes sp. TEM]|uniref:YgjV family protein n=1 Tax=Rhodoplanes tepidamans TaxID=200616 RepID=A0ABT5JIT3_RHOTP|nr:MULTISPECIES: YgjV family protein [Rhodoplanes]MDC7789413.1 YgjV family protein [Rhodoplanes tepidamans]MDC7986459.1 YgjV family protein [Rhodoplanes sp. TEM]MDQ0358951.1 hypothetical protein [Rhodoplanes tepidamans]
MDFFAPAQIAGYAAFVLGMAAFLQTSDRPLKLLNGLQCIAYAIHFFMLGNIPAMATAIVSAARSFLALRTTSPLLAVVVVAILLAIGSQVVTHWTGWLPVAASSFGTLAVFLMRGIPMRLVMLACCLMWLANNVLSGSIGGTLLEGAIAVAMTSTIVRMVRARRAAAAA